MKVEVCQDAPKWDAYVSAHPLASPYHRWIWKDVIETTFGHRTFYLAVEDKGRIQGVLPMVAMRSLLFGRFIVSIPYFSYGGVLADSAEASEALLNRAAETAKDWGARYIELRQGGNFGPAWSSTSEKVAMVVPLPATVEGLWNGLNSRLRNKVRNAKKNGFQQEWGGEELVDDFYRVFADNMRNLGTPVYPRRWFSQLCRLCKSDVRILLIREEGKPVAAALVNWFRDTVELPWISSTSEARRRHSTVLLYWNALEWAVANGFRHVDLGRCTRGGGTYQFKQQWNCEERPLHWYYWLAPGAAIPELRPDNPRYRWATHVWKRLPLFMANGIGPHIVRSIP